MITGRLEYNRDEDRYGLLQSDIWEKEGFHCGDPMEVMVDGEWIETRMEIEWNEKGHTFLESSRDSILWKSRARI